MQAVLICWICGLLSGWLIGYLGKGYVRQSTSAQAGVWVHVGCLMEGRPPVAMEVLPLWLVRAAPNNKVCF